MKVIANCLGVILCGTALIGFMDNDFMKMDLSPLHNCFLLLIGAACFYFGVQGTIFQARYMCRVVGVLFFALGAMTLLAGPGTATAGGVEIQSDHVLRLIPNQLEYTTADGIRDLIVGVVGLIAGFLPRQQEIDIEDRAAEIKDKVASGR